MVLDVRRGGTGLIGPALLHPVAPPRLDHDRAVGGDAVDSAQLAQTHGAGDELAFEGLVVPNPIDGGRLRLISASVIAATRLE